MFETSDKYNSHLTTLAQGLWLYPGKEIDLMGVFFPMTAVDTAVGSFDKYLTAPALTPVDTRLARDNSPRRIQLNKVEGHWSCHPHALEIATDGVALLQKDATRIHEAHTRTLMSSFFTSRQVNAINAVKSNVASESTLGTWGDDTDIIGELETLCKKVVMGCGKQPNKLVLGHTAWTKLRNHASFVSRIQGITTALTPEDLLSVLAYKGMEIVIADNMADINGTMTELLANDVIVLFNEATPSLEDMSFGKEFSLTPDGPEMLTYDENGGVRKVDALMWASDYQVINAASCARLEITDAA